LDQRGHQVESRASYKVSSFLLSVRWTETVTLLLQIQEFCQAAQACCWRVLRSERRVPGSRSRLRGAHQPNWAPKWIPKQPGECEFGDALVGEKVV
jgi:hypothetical protein